MEVVQVNGDVIGELSQLVKQVGEQQREIVLELSKELGKHNKQLEKALQKEDRLLARVNRIEEKMMQKEIYNYSAIYEKIKQKKDQQNQVQRSREQDENLVPAIFDDMEKAENSDGFDSCDDDGEQVLNDNNPFKRFKNELDEIKDENLKLTLSIGRKMIVDYIESKIDSDYDDWKVFSTTNEKPPITIWNKKRQQGLVSIKVSVPIPNCKLDDILPFLLNADKRQEFDQEIEKIKIIKEYPVNTGLVLVNMKQQWPVGPRDALVNQQLVRFEDKAWIVNHSVEDDEVPPVSGVTRISDLKQVFYFKPNPEIRGYTVLSDFEFNYGGNLPTTLVQNNVQSKGLKVWGNLQKFVIRDATKRIQEEAKQINS